MSFKDRISPVKPGPECAICRTVSHYDDQTFADYNEGIAAYRAGEVTRADLARAFGFKPDNFAHHWFNHVVPSLLEVSA